MDEKLLAMLLCPTSQTTLRYDAEQQRLISDAAGLCYPIKNGIPILLKEAAEKYHESR
ncbi:MAG: Trm112 family protein [Alphaproteobacteria bacterium]|nr:Trm112 family protein [Alphaproteobacteria bacterium]